MASHTARSSKSNISFMIMSDTHGLNIWNEKSQKPPKVDVLLHCGDLSSIGGMTEYRETMDLLKEAEAELKLVIPGNHDVSLDETWWAGDNLDEDDDPKMPAKARALFGGEEARKANVVLLEQGLHKFTLKSGATFRIWVTPYTPAFNGYAFAYEGDENPFTCIPTGVDIIMTHGPPLGFLDRTSRGENAGCPKLLEAICKAKPALHCFGHIHEGYGARILKWKKNVPWSSEVDTDVSSDGVRSINLEDTVNGAGERTLMVNAAILDAEHKPTNAPWVVSMSLPTSASNTGDIVTGNNMKDFDAGGLVAAMRRLVV